MGVFGQVLGPFCCYFLAIEHNGLGRMSQDRADERMRRPLVGLLRAFADPLVPVGCHGALHPSAQDGTSPPVRIG